MGYGGSNLHTRALGCTQTLTLAHLHFAPVHPVGQNQATICLTFCKCYSIINQVWSAGVGGLDLKTTHGRSGCCYNVWETLSPSPNTERRHLGVLKSSASVSALCIYEVNGSTASTSYIIEIRTVLKSSFTVDISTLFHQYIQLFSKNNLVVNMQCVCIYRFSFTCLKIHN